jgi:hypothetical protein
MARIGGPATRPALPKSGRVYSLAGGYGDLVAGRSARLVGAGVPPTLGMIRTAWAVWTVSSAGSKLVIFVVRADTPLPTEPRDSEGSGIIALILGADPDRGSGPLLHSWAGLRGSCEANVTSVFVRNGCPVDDVFEIDASGSTREAAVSAAGNNLVLASAFNL